MLVEIVLPLALPGPLVYRLPKNLENQAVPGVRVLVPVGNRHRIGCLLGSAAPGSREKFKGPVKEVLDILDEEPTLGPHELNLLQWSSEYYLTPVGEVLRHLIPPRLLQFQKLSRRSALTTDGPAERTPGGEDQIEGPHTVGSGGQPALTPDQRAAVEKIGVSLSGNSASTFLLHGITGSGKTEVYIDLARRVLSAGGQVLVLVPEIGLTPQLVTRFGEAIGRRPRTYHSAMTPAQRLEVWQQCRVGKIDLVIGTRSAIFLSFPNLRLIVVDEEHDPSFKQEERFCYNARDLALWRGKEEKLTVLLGSATPSLETLHRVREGKIVSLSLPNRPGVAVLPTVRVVDRRKKSADGGSPFLSPELLDSIGTRLRRGEQSLLFLNRRGFAPFLLCPRCGHIPRCSGCEISLTYHRKTAQLLCHYCDEALPFSPSCEKCSGPFTPHGIGTEGLEHELRRRFPGARIGRLDRDSARGGLWKKTLAAVAKREIDLLIGTQMVTKGHDFPHLTLVGIIDADVALNLPDFRAAERAFQILTQVSGRAGRGEKPGEVIIQTYHPDHAGIVSAAQHDGQAFYDREMTQRREAGYPPFMRLIQLRWTGNRRERVIETAKGAAQILHRKIPRSLATILGPAPCPIEKIRGKSRWHLLMKAPDYSRLQPILRNLLDGALREQLPSQIKLLVNVNPIDMM